MRMFVLPVRYIFIEIADRNPENVCDLVKPSRTDSVHAFFVFLNLLKGEPQHLAEFFLTHANEHPAQPDAITDLSIDGICLFFGHCRQKQISVCVPDLSRILPLAKAFL